MVENMRKRESTDMVRARRKRDRGGRKREKQKKNK